MPYYMTQAYCRHATLALLEPPEERAGAVARLLAARGGRLHHMHWDTDNGELLAIYEMPGNQAAAEAMVAILGADPVTVRTTPLAHPTPPTDR